MGSPNSTPSPSLHIEVLANNTSHTLQHEVIFIRQEQNPRIMNHKGNIHYEMDRLARLDVPDFNGDKDPDIYLDWLHIIVFFLVAWCT